MFRFLIVVILTVTFNCSEGQVLINEVVTDPQTDWSTTSFSGIDGGGSISDGVDEFIELYITQAGISLVGWTIELLDGSDVVGDLTSTGAFDISNYISSSSGSFSNTQAGDYLVLGNVVGSGAMNNTITIRLRNDVGVLIDEVILGGSSAPNGASSSVANECVCRLGNGKDTDISADDFYKTKATLGASNSPDGELVINEIVTSPQTDWSTNNFDGTDGGGIVSDGVDEFIELYIKTDKMNLLGYTIELLDGSDVIGSLESGGAFQVSNYISSSGGKFYDTKAGDYLVLGNVIGSEAMNNNVLIRLRDSNGEIIDSVFLSNNAPSGNSSSKSDEAVSRTPNGFDSNFASDFIDSFASPSFENINLPLPIEMVSFDAEVDSCQVKLTWSTIFEINNDYFSVESSVDGINWIELGEVEGAGNSSWLIHYFFEDKQPSTGMNFYRIKQTDVNGVFSYSPIEVVNFNLVFVDDITVYPNPFQHELSIYYNREIDLEDFQLYSFDNNIVDIHPSDIKRDDRKLKLDTSSLKSGIYFLKSSNSVEKVVKR